jgi:hypothetical protein
MTAHQLILNFHQFILASWPQLSLVMEYLDWDENPYFIDHWFQANWELMVEKQLGNAEVILTPYGYDASPNSRYTKVGAKATHRVICKVEGVTGNYMFMSFVSEVDGSRKLEPPFDRISAKEENGREILLFGLDEVGFELEEIG